MLKKILSLYLTSTGKRQSLKSRQTIALNPDWEQYALLDQAGILRVFTARDNKELVGYCVLVMISKSIHHKDHTFASTDVIYM